MHRRFRLRERERFEYVRRHGQSYREPLAVLICTPNELPFSRFGFSASRRVGRAVQRNRARRLLREAIRLRMDAISSGWDIVLIARPDIVSASFQEVASSCERLLAKANLLHPFVQHAQLEHPTAIQP